MLTGNDAFARSQFMCGSGTIAQVSEVDAQKQRIKDLVKSNSKTLEPYNKKKGNKMSGGNGGKSVTQLH